MAVESADFVNELDETKPAGSEFKFEGDNHLRVIKNAIKGQFPNFVGVAIANTEADINTSIARVIAVTPSFGSAASEDAGTAIGEVLVIANVGGVAGLPAMDGSQLTGVATTNTLVADIPIMTTKNAKVKMYFYGQL